MGKEVLFPFMITGKQLEALEFVPADWIIEDLVQANERRMTLLCGQSGAGKSTLAIQMAAAVLMGEPFLGKATQQCETMYWQTEGLVRNPKNALHKLGYRSSKHAEVHVFRGMPADSSLKHMHDYLIAHPAIKFVIIETITGLLHFDDGNDNSCVQNSFDRFDDVMGDLLGKVGFCGLAPLKKSDNEKSGTMILGASAIAERGGIKLYLRTKSDKDDRRIFHSTVREDGIPIKEVYIEHDHETGRSSFGATLADERKNGPDATVARIDADLKTYLLNHTDSLEPNVLGCTDGNGKLKGQRLQKLVREDWCAFTGTGRCGSPRVYNVVRIPFESQVTETQTVTI